MRELPDDLYPATAHNRKIKDLAERGIQAAPDISACADNSP